MHWNFISASYHILILRSGAHHDLNWVVTMSKSVFHFQLLLSNNLQYVNLFLSGLLCFPSLSSIDHFLSILHNVVCRQWYIFEGEAHAVTNIMDILTADHTPSTDFSLVETCCKLVSGLLMDYTHNKYVQVCIGLDKIAAHVSSAQYEVQPLK